MSIWLCVVKSIILPFNKNCFTTMKKKVFKLLAKVNKVILPSFTKQGLDLSKATKIQMAIFGWKVYVTKNALD